MTKQACRFHSLVVILMLAGCGAATAPGSNSSTDAPNLSANQFQTCLPQQLPVYRPKFTVNLWITTDSLGRIRAATPDASETEKLKDPAFATIMQDVIEAVTDPRCNQLHLPRQALGQDQHFPFSMEITQTASH